MIGLPLILLAAEPVVDKKSELTQMQTDEIIKLVDERQRNSGDYKSLVFVKETEKKKEPRLFQAMVYRRDEDDKFMILFTKPKEEAGKAYLKIDKNLWNFDPGTGKWERRTERENTNSCTSGSTSSVFFFFSFLSLRVGDADVNPTFLSSILFFRANFSSTMRNFPLFSCSGRCATNRRSRSEGRIDVSV